MSTDWYDKIAKRNKGYKSDAHYQRVGISGEEIFEKELIILLKTHDHVLDIGCGHGEFTLKMSEYTQNIVGVDNSKELLKIANNLKDTSDKNNVTFKYAWTKGEFDFEDDSFDLIYSRRGPTSIVNHSRILKPGGLIVGIHTFDLDLESYEEKLLYNGFHNFEARIFEEAFLKFENKTEFAKFLAARHCSVDYTLPEHETSLNNIVSENIKDGQISWQEKRYIWRAVKKEI